MFTLEKAQKHFMRTLNHGPDILPGNLFNGPLDRILLGLKAHANTINHARLVALEESFPLTRTHIGAEAFNALSRHYIDTPCAKASDNNSIGHGFPIFLEHEGVEKAVFDLSLTEWAWLESYHAADAKPLELASISGLSEDALLDFNIIWHPATRMVHVATPLSPQLSYLGNASAILIVRPEEEVRLLALDGATAQIASICEKSTSIGNLLALATEQEGITDPIAPILMLINAGALITQEK
jgi:Putative DNA-binding domain